MKKEAEFKSYNILIYIKRTIIQIQTVQPKKYLKWFGELQLDDGHLLPILTSYS